MKDESPGHCPRGRSVKHFLAGLFLRSTGEQLQGLALQFDTQISEVLLGFCLSCCYLFQSLLEFTPGDVDEMCLWQN